MPTAQIYRFDGIMMDPAAMRLCRGATELALEPKTFRLLQFLIDNRERVLGKEEIFRVVWENRAVSDNALTRAIAQIRKALDDDPRHPRYIDTIPTIGYRFIGELELETALLPTPAKPARAQRGLILVFLAIAFAMVAIIVFVYWRSRQRIVAAPMSAPVPLTTYRGSEDSPTFSPDGDQVAFVWNDEKQDNEDIYVKTLRSDATPVRLTSNSAPDVWPAWSPDGRTIAFQRLVSSNQTDLILIPALGGPERKLAEFHPWLDVCSRNVAWSADSKWLIVPMAAASGETLFRVSADTGEAAPILTPEDSVGVVAPSLSPDGRTLLFIRHPAFNWGQLWMVHVDGQLNATDAPHQVPSAKDLLVQQAVWMPDDQSILASTSTGPVRIALDSSGGVTPLPQFGSFVRSFAVSARSRRMAYASIQGDSNIWRMNLSARFPHPEPVIASTMRDVYPEYSPDGKRIAFHSHRNGAASDVWIADADGSNQRQLTFFNKGNTGSAHWSPDGRTISFDSNSSGVYQIYTIRADGGKVEQLTNNAYPSFGTSWSHDGRWLYFTSRATGRNEVWKMSTEGGPSIQITHNGGWMGVESPDSKALFFCKDKPSGSLWEMPLNGGPERELFDSLYRNNFAVTTRGIYYITSPLADGTSRLMLYRFATGKSTLILPIGIPDYGLDVSPDGLFIAYAQVDNPASDLMLVENLH